MTALPIEGYAREYTDAATLRAAYAARKRRLAEIFATGIAEAAPEKVSRLTPEVKPQVDKVSPGVRWDEDEVALLRKLQAEHKNAREIAAAVGRSISSIHNKAWYLGLSIEPVPREPAQKKNRGRKRRDWLKLTVINQKFERATKQIVLGVVCDATGFTPEEIRGDRRDKHTVIARHITYLMMKRHTPLSLPQIGMYLGDKDHTTILSGIGSIQHKAATDLDLAHHIEAISALINSRVSDKPLAVAEAA